MRVPDLGTHGHFAWLSPNFDHLDLAVSRAVAVVTQFGKSASTSLGSANIRSGAELFVCTGAAMGNGESPEAGGTSGITWS